MFMLLKRRLFSKKKENKIAKNLAAAGTGIGLAIGVDKLTDKPAEHFADKLMNSELKAKDASKIKDKLIKSAKNQGIKVVEDKNTSNAAYVGSKLGKKLKNALAGGIKKLKKSNPEQAREITKELNKSAKRTLPSEKMWKNLGKDAIVVGRKGKLSEADVLSHEIGHAQYMQKGRSKSIVGKVAHKGMAASKLATSKVGTAGFAAHGFHSGVKSERLKQEGKKEGKWNKVKSTALPAMAVAPLLIAEGKASANGLKRMKNLGASKQLLKESRRSLGNAWGNYASKAANPIIAGEAGRLAGKGYGKLTKTKKDRDEK